MQKTVFMGLFLSLVLYILGYGSVFSSVSFSKTSELPPIRISFSHLQDAIAKAAKLARTANVEGPTQREKIELRAEGFRITLEDPPFNLDNMDIPSEIHYFDYSLYTFDPAPVSSITLKLSDFERYVSAEGNSIEQVSAVVSVLRDDMFEHTIAFGGPTFRNLFRLLSLSLLGFVSIILLYPTVKTGHRAVVIPFAISVTLIFIIIFAPLRELLSGFLAARNDPSILVRYGSEISFLALVIGLIGLLWPLISFILRKEGGNGAKE